MKKLQSLLTSQRHYYKAQLRKAQDRETADILHESCKVREKALKLCVSELECELVTMELDTPTSKLPIVTKDGLAYSSTVRKCICYALQHQCAMDHAASIVQYVAEQFTGQQLHPMPCPATVAKMGREMGLLADVEAGQALATTSDCSIAWDATQLAGAHISEVQGSLSS